MKTHKWKNKGAKQYSQLGLNPSEGESYHECSNCGASVSVRYNSGEGIGEAMQRIGVKEECEKGEESNTEGGIKIFCFINGGYSDCWEAIAIGENGRIVGNHVCSNEGWAKHDLGVTSDSKHDNYNEAYPNGWELIWVDDPKNHSGLQAAYKLNQQTPKL